MSSQWSLRIGSEFAESPKSDLVLLFYFISRLQSLGKVVTIACSSLTLAGATITLREVDRTAEAVSP